MTKICNFWGVLPSAKLNAQRAGRCAAHSQSRLSAARQVGNVTYCLVVVDGRRTSTIQNALLEEQVRRARSVDGRLSTYKLPCPHRAARLLFTFLLPGCAAPLYVLTTKPGVPRQRFYVSTTKPGVPRQPYPELFRGQGCAFLSLLSNVNMSVM